MAIKRIFDFVVALLGLMLLSPLFFIIALVIRTHTPGSVIFCQERVGRGGRLFTLYKFRTMKPGSNGNSITVRGEERITKVGAFLRKHKLDVLPELWNVLIGDMSLVGPRPDVPGYADRLEGDDRLVLSVKPGITGPATLKYAREEELLANSDNPQQYNDEVIYPDKVRINKKYIENRSMVLDLKIIIFTLLGKKPNDDRVR
jgi:lipopolysaccharide/colanic/teichoic acid biosynthesis glycosyltransferase